MQTLSSICHKVIEYSAETTEYGDKIKNWKPQLSVIQPVLAF